MVSEAEYEGLYKRYQDIQTKCEELKHELKNQKSANSSRNKVWVRWHDGYMEEFEASEVRFGSDLLWMRLANGENRHIPLRSVRWFGMQKESHAINKEE